MPGLLELARKRLDWPSRQDIMRPKGSGPAVVAELARRKLKTAIEREQENVRVEVGVLAANPCSDRTEEPLAIVCDFGSTISEDLLRKTHRLAWSFSRSPMLITIEPNAIKVWTCWKKAVEDDEDISGLCVEHADRSLFTGPSLSAQAARALQWVELASGSFLRKDEYSEYFKRDQRADQLMLEDLKVLRRKLLDAKLPEDICHDLIARVIFVEFLFQRKDSQGNAALNEKVLAKLHERRVLRKSHEGLSSILRDRGETYRFFRELNERFNGDLFPGKGDREEEREREWKAEMESVKGEHLNQLGEFVRGEMEIATRQRCLWKRYAFDVIPLEFISSIYEEFVNKKKGSGVHYTPIHIVDYMLDSVLPWNDRKWDIKILDPACGSGIFLVKAYQRLIHRWKMAHGPEEKLGTQELRDLLENSLLGVDIDPHAVRVASFSLYLAMCDELEPRYVWQNVKFPRLRDRRLIESDFFAEDQQGIRTDGDKGTFDLVIGNAPWGHATETELSREWANLHGWPIPNRNVGPLFLCKSLHLVKADGSIIMLQPAGAVLFNRKPTADRFRRRLFGGYRVDEVVNLSVLRFGLFKNAISPACIIRMGPQEPDGMPIEYTCPKPSCTREDDYHVVIEPHDRNPIYAEEAASDCLVWTALAWGGRRDLALMRRLCDETNLEKLENEGTIRTRRGIGRGKRIERQDAIVGMPLLDSETFPEGTLLYLDAARLELNQDPFVYGGHSKDMSAFNLPQLILKSGWRKSESGRFKAALVKSNEELGPVLCSREYTSVHAPPEHQSILTCACIVYNSKLAVYFLLLSSGRFAFYIPSPNKEDLLRIPVKKIEGGLPASIITAQDVDDCAKDVFGAKDAEWTLIEDLFDYTLADFKGGEDSPGRKSTISPHERHGGKGTERVLVNYIDYFGRVLRAGFGEDRQISATIFREEGETCVPVRLVAIHLEAPKKSFINVEEIDSASLIERLKMLDERFLKSQADDRRGGIFYQRVARVYDSMRIEGKDIPTVFIIKPDQVRYWTRSMAMRDADEVAGEIMLWREEAAAMRG